jgi:hypothetical protein
MAEAVVHKMVKRAIELEGTVSVRLFHADIYIFKRLSNPVR